MWNRSLTFGMVVAVLTTIGLFYSAGPVGPVASAQDPAYQTRRADCHCQPPLGKALEAKRTDTGVQVSGPRAERLLTYAADSAGLQGGTIAVCAEYGRVEVIDSDDSHVRLQVRCEAYGKGAAKAIEETDLRVHLTAHEGKLGVAVWHATLGFTPESQPCWVNIRLQVPASGAYTVNGTAYHGIFGIRRVSLARGKLRGRVGEKYKGVKGYQGGLELDHVRISGDLDVFASNAPIFGKLYVLSSCKVLARTGEGDIRLAIYPDRGLGLDVFAASNEGIATVGVGDAEQLQPEKGGYRSQQHARTKGFEDKPTRVEIKAISSRINEIKASNSQSNVTVVSDATAGW